ncbi:hypothetical protein AAFF_G00300140 [Aldrovandia affinis]|uniref:Uncharacterized protein n=1 Tax=Aldrovandia affinis TaxID=143900 RepID=A0AAD7WRK8_9TELE|nr:hypothetical protein AAFF_G00300140 [Aldrovandia affinis]
MTRPEKRGTPDGEEGSGPPPSPTSGVPGGVRPVAAQANCCQARSHPVGGPPRAVWIQKFLFGSSSARSLASRQPPPPKHHDLKEVRARVRQ